MANLGQNWPPIVLPHQFRNVGNQPALEMELRKALYWLVAGCSIGAVLIVLVTLGLTVLRGASSNGFSGAIGGVASYFRSLLAPVVDAATSNPGVGALIVLALLGYALAMAYLAQSRLEKIIMIGLVPLAIVSIPMCGVLAIYVLAGPFIMSP